MRCSKCRDYFPPGFTENVKNTTDYLCVFCKLDKKSIPYQNGVVTREEIVNEYKEAIKEILRKNDIILKNKQTQLTPHIII